MKLEMIPLMLLVGFAAAVPACAQIPMPAAPTPAAPAVAANYQIAPSDVLSVNVVKIPTLTASQVMVAPDGTISLPLLDQVSVTGLTTEQATRLLATKWKKYVINPSVTVSLIQKHAQTVVLNGFLNRTGSIDYRPGLHLLEALAQMGGAMTSADASISVLTHADGTKQTLDLSHPERKAGSEVDVELQPGDVLYVPEQQGKISVVGQVKNPGNLYYREKLTVLDAINLSGGYDPDRADLFSSTLTHNGVTRKIDLDALLRKGDLSANADLAPGDIVALPELHNRVYVYGDVQRQGYYYYKPQDRLTDAFASAGLAPDADTGKINVIHVSNGNKKEAHLIRVNLNKFLHEGDISGNPEIQPGDSLYIPRQHQQLKLGDILNPLQAIGSLAYSARVLGY